MSDNQDLCTMSVSDLAMEYNTLDWACTADNQKDEDVRRMQNRLADVMTELERRDGYTCPECGAQDRECSVGREIEHKPNCSMGQVPVQFHTSLQVRTFANTREDIDAMVADVEVQMKAKLLLTRHRKHWSKCDLHFLVSRLKDEVKELEEACMDFELMKSSQHRKAVISELSDVMNFAAFAMDNLMHAGTRPWDSKEGS